MENDNKKFNDIKNGAILVIIFIFLNFFYVDVLKFRGFDKEKIEKKREEKIRNELKNFTLNSKLELIFKKINDIPLEKKAKRQSYLKIVGDEKEKIKNSNNPIQIYLLGVYYAEIENNLKKSKETFMKNMNKESKLLRTKSIEYLVNMFQNKNMNKENLYFVDEVIKMKNNEVIFDLLREYLKKDNKNSKDMQLQISKLLLELSKLGNSDELIFILKEYGNKIDNDILLKEVYLKALTFSNNPNFMKKLAKIYEKEGKSVDAKIWFKKAQGYNLKKVNMKSKGTSDYECIGSGTRKDLDRNYEVCLEKADELIKEEEYQEAVNKYKIAKKYSPKAYFELGKLYFKLNENAKAKEELEKGYEKGVIEVSNELGNIYLAENDKKKSEKYFERGAFDGDAKAQINYAISLEKKGDKRAVDWYIRAYEQNEGSAVYYLIVYYYKQGNISEAHKWSKIYIEKPLLKNVYSEYKERIKFAMENKNNEYIKIYDETINLEDLKKREENILKMIQYNKEDYIQLGLFYVKNLKDNEKGLETFRKAQELGVKNAQYYLYVYGEKEKKLEKEIKILEESAKLGIMEIQYELGMYYYEESLKNEHFEKEKKNEKNLKDEKQINAEVDNKKTKREKALQYLRNSAKQGYALAIVELFNNPLYYSENISEKQEWKKFLELKPVIELNDELMKKVYFEL